MGQLFLVVNVAATPSETTIPAVLPYRSPRACFLAGILEPLAFGAVTHREDGVDPGQQPHVSASRLREQLLVCGTQHSHE